MAAQRAAAFVKAEPWSVLEKLQRRDYTDFYVRATTASLLARLAAVALDSRDLGCVRVECALWRAPVCQCQSDQ